MPAPKSGSGPGPLLMHANATGKSGSGGLRGAHDPTGFSSPTGGTSGVSFGDASLSSPELVRQLLTIARGDLSAVVTALAPDAANSHESSNNAHPVFVGRAAAAAAAAASVVDGIGSGSESGGVSRTSMAKVAPAVAAESAPAGRAPVPVAVLRCTAPSHHADPTVDEAAASLTSNSASTCVSTDADVSAFYLTALAAHALHREDYWVDLRHQIEVDHHVEFIQFCAEAGFGTLKTMHLLQWWKQYRALVRSATATQPLRLSDGNPLAVNAADGAFATPTAATGAEVVSAATTSPASAAGGAAKGTSKKARRGSATSTAANAAEAEAAPAAGTFPPFAPPGPQYTTHEEALRGELQRFVQWELEHEYEWRLVPREPFSGGAAMGGGGGSLLSPVGGSGAAAAGGSSVGSTASSSAAAGGKSSKADKAKMQQQQQQELEWEEQRLARIASLPPENIFLTSAEAHSFVRRAITEDLATHAALHVYVATTAEGRPTRTLTHAAAAPVCLSVQVEVPMPVPPLREAVRPSAPVVTSTPPATPRPSNDAVAAASGHNGPRSPKQTPTRPTSSAPSKPRSRMNSKGPAGANVPASTAPPLPASVAADATEEASAAVPSRPAVVLSAMEALRAEQAKEAAAYRAAYAEELASAAAQEQQRRHAADVNLYFEKATTQAAVQAVYASMEDSVATRQQRILQRVAALEVALGVTEGEGRDNSVGE